VDAGRTLADFPYMFSYANTVDTDLVNRAKIAGERGGLGDYIPQNWTNKHPLSLSEIGQRLFL